MPTKHDEITHLLRSPRNAERLFRSIRASEVGPSTMVSPSVEERSFEDFLVELAKQDAGGVLKRISTHLDQHLAKYGRDSSAERSRLAAAFKDRAPDNAVSQTILELILR
jgi:DnaJ-domain-containing protein 1